MRKTFLLLLVLALCNCATTANITKSQIVGVWQHKIEDGRFTFFEFRNDNTGSYGIGKTLNECDCGHEFSWSVGKNSVHTTGLDGGEFEDTYFEVIIVIDLETIFQDGKLKYLKPRTNDYLLQKKA